MKRGIKDANNQSEQSFLHSVSLKKLSNFPQGVVNCLCSYYLVTMVNVGIWPATGVLLYLRP